MQVSLLVEDTGPDAVFSGISRSPGASIGCITHTGSDHAVRLTRALFM